MSHSDRLDELSSLLAQRGRITAPVDQVHGMLTAAVCGPVTTTPGRWLRLVFPDAQPKDFRALLKQKRVERIVTLLLELYDDLLFSIRQATFVPHFGPDKENRTFGDCRGWCTGFLHGMTLHDKEWLDHDSEQLATLVAPILYIADTEGLGQELGPRQRAKLAKMEPQLIEAIRYNVPKIYDYWNLGKKVEVKKNVLDLS
jgi:yecA family protein